MKSQKMGQFNSIFKQPNRLFDLTTHPNEYIKCNRQHCQKVILAKDNWNLHVKPSNRSRAPCLSCIDCRLKDKLIRLGLGKKNTSTVRKPTINKREKKCVNKSSKRTHIERKCCICLK